MLILHHLGVSQSERIVWLLEELNLPYELVKHTRDPLAAPQSLQKAPGNLTGKAPFLIDTTANVTLNESGAICEYIITIYGNGKLAPEPGSVIYATYLQFFHFANATLQSAMLDRTLLAWSMAPPEDPILKLADGRLQAGLKVLDARLGQSQWLAGEFSVADIMTLYVTSTQRYWGPQIDLGLYPNIVRWMGDCGKREAYQKAIEKGDPEMQVLLGAEAPSIGMGEAGGVTSDHWKKIK